MYPRSEFEVILIRFPRRYFSKLKYRKNIQKCKKLLNIYQLVITYILMGMIQRITVENLKKF